MNHEPDWEAMAKELLERLKEAKNVIRLFHGELQWVIYDRLSPEMQRLNAAITRAQSLMEKKS